MDTYLEIAEWVLRAARRPMTPSAILQAAYRAGIVPTHLRGKTQHKTLQARLSENILSNRLESKFYRTDPGRFYLTEFRFDPNLPERFRDPFYARRRTRDLPKSPALAIKKSFFDKLLIRQPLDTLNLLESAISQSALGYVCADNDIEGYILISTFSIVRRRKSVLSYRMGRYRDDRDAFANRQSIGFREIVSYNDRTFFSHDKFGLSDCSLNTVLSDLCLSRRSLDQHASAYPPRVLFSLRPENGRDKSMLLVVMDWRCPDWFEPTARRLSLNDMRWLDLTSRLNNIDDFEPWSADVINLMQPQLAHEARDCFEKAYGP